MKHLLIILAALFGYAAAAQNNNLPITVNTNGVLNSTNFFRRNQATLGLETVLRTNGTAVGVLNAEQIQATLVSAAVQLPNVANGFNDPVNYAAPISMVMELTPRVADTLVDLLAVPMLAKAERGVSVWAYVLGGPNPGTYCFCPLLTTPQNLTSVWRPNDIPNDTVAGRWVLMSTGGGATGPQGPAGPAGTPGTIWYSAAGVPGTGLGIVGDRYLNTTNGDHYEKTGTTSWTLRGNLKGADGATGATGPTGPAGATGAAGAPGAVWRSGTGAPAGGLGIVGDWYLNDANGDVYEKTGASTYTLRDNLTGPAGGGSSTPSADPNNGLFLGTDGAFFAGTSEYDVFPAMAALGSQFKASTVGVNPITTSSSQTVNLTDARVHFVAIWVPRRMTLTGIGFNQSNAGSFTPDEYNGVGLYSYSAGTLTLVASSANNGATFSNGVNTWAKIPFSPGTVTVNAGLYFAAVLYNSSAQTTAPALRASPALVGNHYATMDFSNGAKFSATLATQTTLPASTTMAALTEAQGLPVLYVY